MKNNFEITHNEEGANISSDFLYLKILAQPEFAKVYKSEIANACENNPEFCGNIGASWSDAAFDIVSDIVIKLCVRNPELFKVAQKRWLEPRRQKLGETIGNNRGRLSLTDSQGGELSIADDNRGALSFPDESEHKSG